VVRPNPDQRRPVTVLEWQEGERTQVAAADAASATDPAAAAK
jgi:hypothetical protein